MRIEVTEAGEGGQRQWLAPDKVVRWVPANGGKSTCVYLEGTTALYIVETPLSFWRRYKAAMCELARAFGGYEPAEASAAEPDNG